MIVVTPEEMLRLESVAFREGASEDEFMDEAGAGVALTVQEFVERRGLAHKVLLLVGKGNNGGDALTAGMHLLQLDYDVSAYLLYSSQDMSSLAKHALTQFSNAGGHFIEQEHEFLSVDEGIILDGIFGTGFRGKIEGLTAAFIEKVKGMPLPVLAIDIPSGMNAETGEIRGSALMAEETAFLGLPKTGFFLGEGWDYVGKLRFVDFGLASEVIQKGDSPFEMLTPDLLQPLLPKPRRSRHKYEVGVVAGWSGSPGMPGAALLACTAALRGGAGLVRLACKPELLGELSSAPYELIRKTYEKKEELLKIFQDSQAAFIGPAIGLDDDTAKVLTYLLDHVRVPLVIDADAITLIAEKQLPIPQGSIITPHKKELARLLGKKKLGPFSMDLILTCQEYVEKHDVVLIAKGAPTFIFRKGNRPYVSAGGDPGMATAGSGDVLTGLLAALLAQGLFPEEAAALGVFIHGSAGEFAAMEYTSFSMIASDIISYFPEGFRLQTL